MTVLASLHRFFTFSPLRDRSSENFQLICIIVKQSWHHFIVFIRSVYFRIAVLKNKTKKKTKNEEVRKFKSTNLKVKAIREVGSNSLMTIDAVPPTCGRYCSDEGLDNIKMIYIRVKISHFLKIVIINLD